MVSTPVLEEVPFAFHARSRCSTRDGHRTPEYGRIRSLKSQLMENNHGMDLGSSWD